MKKTLTVFLTCGISAATFANNLEMTDTMTPSIKVQMNALDLKNGNAPIGDITITESKHGLVFTPNLTGLMAGLHGFHIHQNPSCEPKEKNDKMVAGLAAGGHWDPMNAGQHGHPWEDNAHLGDLPALTVNHDGTATNPVLAPRLKHLDEVKGHAIMIHAGGDNHSDHPAKLGGGGPRMACGVIK
ncbi:Superoxide dismutase [Cu-Zn] precursor [Phocoenobacter uteri]|uniref:Superoxide dismutase [Cu-Zn] n=1 Tax=Phocoenobacter uteri TaxID=146806 RepID=A0A379CB23_9PAST|nr:superoxide dismutase family protein [Phocoenobacter uteri]MDG6882758.1 superoxide dismutase [Phocoenobacter uteri]SUB58925.1 Superoxide dismutase [Cu-Zn] precursor [Phocoenobacter uteri]